ncbi:MAG: amino acid adenylation domain-containing protein, partial [Acidobacteriota bacterium]
MANFSKNVSQLTLEEKRKLLAQLLKKKASEGAASYHIATQSTMPTVKPAPAERHLPFPLRDIQQAYWIGRSETFELGNVADHVYVEVEGPNIDVGRFAQAFRQLIQRHEMLRAIVLSDGQQQILPEVPAYQIEVLDLHGQQSEVVNTHLQAIRERMSHQVLKTDEWPLFEVRASLLDNERVRFHISLDLLIADVWSVQIIFREWVQFYLEPEKVFPPLTISFRDYLFAEISSHNTESYQRSQRYWRQHINNLPPAPELPLIKKPSAITHPRFVRHMGKLSPTTWSKLKDRASNLSITPSGLLLAAYAEILTAWSKRPRFTLNLPLFKRLPVHPQVNEIVGNFTSSILLAIDNSGADSFEVRARRLQQQLWRDLEHSNYSGIQVLRDIARAQGGSNRATMPVVFNGGFLGTSTPAGPRAGIAEKIYTITQTPQVWLDHQANEEEGALLFNWDVVEELFPAGLIDDMFGAYCQLLNNLAEQEECWDKVTQQLIPPIQLEQRRAINATAATISTKLLHTLFAEQVEQRPDQTAIVIAQRILTYQELYNRANQLAHQLRQLGAVPNTLVGVVMEKGWEQVVAVLAILQAGAAYLPIEATLPQERRNYLLEHGGVSLVLTQSWWNEQLEWPEQIQRLCVDNQAYVATSRPLTPLQKPEDLAYVIYTSGSTGLPKGVMIDHLGAVNTVLDINQRFQVGPEDCVLAISSLSFDLSVYDIFGLLAAGGTVVIPEAATTRDPAYWVKLIEEKRVTIWNSVPALMKMLVDYLAGRAEPLPASLRLTLLSGDWIPVALPSEIKTRGKELQVISLGGATEASIWSILYPIEEVDPTWKSIPYGRPMVNQSFHVLNDQLEPCPVWVAGQLYIGGIGVAKGYWRDEAKTQASFIIYPQTGERLYRTGDLGRYLPDGNIEFLGREDFQVKIQGYRIELGEIEATLAQYPGVRECVVVAREDIPGDKRLAAYLVMQSEVESRELSDFLQQRLPEYMRPSAFVILDHLPLSYNGKVERRLLPTPERAKTEASGEFVAPRSANEEILANIWAEVLRLERVGVNSNFFELGGDSILSIQIITKAGQGGIQISPRQIFQYPTIAQLALVAGSTKTVTAAQETVTGAVPLTAIQHWFFEQQLA